MNKNQYILLVLTLCTALLAQAQTAVFNEAYIGGGGYITGIVQNPHQPDVLFARSDVGGVFKTENGGRTWRAVNAGMTKWYQHHVRSIAIDTVQPNIVYRAGGEMIGHQQLGYVHQSTDGGETWTLLTDSADFFGNGSTRMCGEMIAINPLNHNIISVGSYSKGLWQSRDKGRTWQCLGLRKQRITVVKYAADGNLYVGTAFDAAIGNEKTLQQCMDFPRKQPSRLYCFAPNGQQTLIAETNKYAFYDFVISANGQIIVAATNRNVMRSTDGGKSFTIIEQLPQKAMYQTIASSPLNPKRIFTARKFSEKDTLRLYVSDNEGADWRLYSNQLTAENYHEFPSYGRPEKDWLGASIACILPDCKNPDKLYFSNYWGVNITYDGGKNYYGHHFSGMGILCGESILKHSATPGCILLAMADHGPLISTDYGENYALLTQNARTSARTLATSRTMPNLLLWSEGSKRTHQGTPLKRTTNGGENIKTTLAKNGDSYVQCLLEDATVNGRFWLMQEGSLTDTAEGAGIYKSDNYGKSWQKVAHPYPAYITQVPHRRNFIDSDFLPVVNYQTKNANGTNQLLACDHFKPNVLYVGEWTEGIWRSTNAGKSWQKISEALPFGNDSTVVLSHLYADPDKRGTLYAGFWKQGLWQSTDFGRSWRKIYPLDGSIFNAVSIAKSGNTIVVACSQHVYADVPAQLMLSTDGGKQWRDIYDWRQGALRFIGIALDADKKRIYATTCGNGAFYIEY